MPAEERPTEATTRARATLNGRPETPPPRPPHELEPSPDCVHHFSADGQDWVARVAGKGAAGTGAYGLGMMEAVHFAAASDPDRPLFETLLARGRFLHLYDEELRALLARATPITAGDPRAQGDNRRGR